MAFDLGLAAGADGLELDVHLARDGRVVVIHDPTLDRSTRATGPVSALTAAELAAVDATPRFGIDLETPWPGLQAGVPTLDEVLGRYGETPLIIEMKGERAELGPAVVAAVRAAAAQSRVCLGSFSSDILDAARRAGPESRHRRLGRRRTSRAQAIVVRAVSRAGAAVPRVSGAADVGPTARRVAPLRPRRPSRRLRPPGVDRERN